MLGRSRRRHKHSSVRVTVHGQAFNLLPLRQEKIEQFQKAALAIMEWCKKWHHSTVADDVEDAGERAELAARALMREILYEAAVVERGELSDPAAFDAWFDGINVFDAFQLVAPATIKATLESSRNGRPNPPKVPSRRSEE